MTRFTMLRAAAATIAVVGLGGLLLVGPTARTWASADAKSTTSQRSPTRSPTPPTTLRRHLIAGSYVTEPFWRPGSGWCFDAASATSLDVWRIRVH
jgi:hypothetical protein